MTSNIQKAVFKKGCLVRYENGRDFEGSRLYKVTSVCKSPIFGVSYAITNGQTNLSNIREELLSKGRRI